MSEELTEQGIVVKSEEGITEIELLSNENCEECSAKLFCKPRGNSSRILQVTDSTKLNEGDKVSISISGKSLLIASFNLYLYPLLILIFSILIGTSLFSNSRQPELFSLSSGIILVIIYYFAFFKISKNTAIKKPNIIITKSV
jgi:sigma-E factor negative regulatory protein RseC